MTKWARVDAAAFSDSSSPRRVAKSSLRAAAKCCAGVFRFFRPAAHRADDPRQENCFRGRIKSRIALPSQSCTASDGFFIAAAAGLRRLSGGGVGCPTLQPGPGIAAPRTRNLARRLCNRKMFQTLKHTACGNEAVPSSRPKRIGCTSDLTLSGTGLWAFYADAAVWDRRQSST